MFLKRIELQGFKSFANKTEIRFDHDITGIVGPNGCGKSNVNDAIRWVLGEQSAKSLRSGSSMSDIIFSGSEKRKPVNMAKVSLVFDNTKRIFDIAYDEVEITRQITRSNNEASYFINKTPCRLKDISDLVMDTGLGKDSLSIITQGNISSFADAKPEERRLLFEEAAGVAKYKKRKKVSLAKLEHTQNNLERLQDIIDSLNERIEPLKKQAEKAEKYIQYKDKLSEIEISVLAIQAQEFKNKLTKVEEELLELNALLALENEKLQKEDEEVTLLRSQMHQLDHEISKIQADYTSLLSESYALEKRKVELDEKRKYLIEQADQKQKAESLKSLVQNAQFEYNDRNNRYKKMQEEYAAAQNEYSQQNAVLNQQKNELNQLFNRIRQLDNQKSVLENAISQPFMHQQGVRSIVQAKNSLFGIEGVVLDLFTPKENMAQAISNALGGSQYHIITSDDKAARNAIGFLKKNRGGRATFLPMSVVKPRYRNENQNTIASNSEGFIGWADDLVNSHPKYDGVKKRLLGNILVFDTLLHANEAAKRLNYSVKIVTLDGDIVHAGGSMTGGSVKNQVSVAAQKQQLEKVKKESKILFEQKNRLQSQISKKELSLSQKSQSLIQQQIEMAKLENLVLVKKEKFENLYGQYQQILGVENVEIDENQQDELVLQMSKMHEQLDALKMQLSTLRNQRASVGKECEEKELSLRELRRSISSYTSQIHQLDMNKVSLSSKLENVLMRLNNEYTMTFESAIAQKKDIDLEKAQKEVVQLKNKIKSLGNVNLEAPEEYKEVSEKYTFYTEQKEDLIKASQALIEGIEEMDQTMSEQFSSMFYKINDELQSIFEAMFGGGKARLSMTEPNDILNTGIEIEVQPPGKKVKSLQTFSGGEKALIAISVLFAILKARTVPLCIFDEVEAALDQANVERFAKYLKNFKDESQFIVVTHRPGTMEECDCLYGVTMEQDGVSQILKVLLQDAVKMQN